MLLLGIAALFAAKAGSDQDDINRLLNFRDQNPGAAWSIREIAGQYEQAMADGPRNERNAKIALIGSAAAAAVVGDVLHPRRKVRGREPAVAIVPAGRGDRATGGLAWRF